jgi:hypothetical protein
MTIVPDPRRVYRALLRVLPREFLAEAESDLTGVFDDAYARCRGGARARMRRARGGSHRSGRASEPRGPRRSRNQSSDRLKRSSRCGA